MLFHTADEHFAFTQKLIVCKLERQVKTSLSGRTLKITQRTNKKEEIRKLTSDEQVKQVLLHEFRISLADLDLCKSDACNTGKVWGHL